MEGKSASLTKFSSGEPISRKNRICSFLQARGEKKPEKLRPSRCTEQPSRNRLTKRHVRPEAWKLGDGNDHCGDTEYWKAARGFSKVTEKQGSTRCPRTRGKGALVIARRTTPKRIPVLGGAGENWAGMIACSVERGGGVG